MLLNEFLKEHRRVGEQGATIAQQRKDFGSELARQQKAFEEKFAQQQKQIKALTTTVRKVSDQIALSKHCTTGSRQPLNSPSPTGSETV
jgi:hypothetical protein